MILYLVLLTNLFVKNLRAKCMQDEFKMSMMRELNFFIGLQIKQTRDDIFINPSKYIKDILKRFVWMFGVIRF